MADLEQRALAAKQEYLALGNERFDAEGATFIRNRRLPQVQHANHVIRASATTPDEIDRLLGLVELEYAGFPLRRFDLDSTAPPELEARLLEAGYRHYDELVLVLEGNPKSVGTPYKIELVTDNSGWEAYSNLYFLDWQEWTSRDSLTLGKDIALAFLHSEQIKSPPVRFWLAYLDGEPRAYCSSWEGTDVVGIVESLFTHPDFRHRGLATALLRHCVADCRTHGAGPVMIGADVADTPKQMYEALGFRPVAVRREYWKAV